MLLSMNLKKHIFAAETTFNYQSSYEIIPVLFMGYDLLNRCYIH